jgi:ribose-phosphate pyrophosphokinase
VGIAKVTYKKFPDGEIYARVADRDADFIVVNSINSSDDITALLLLFDALKGGITVVIPYMGYARQDKVFLEGEAVSIRAIARMIESYTDKVITVNIHSENARSHFKRLRNVDAMPLIGEHFSERNAVMISPDKGSLERVRVAAMEAGLDYDYMEKRRIDATTVEIQPKNIDVEGKDVIIVDDIISTGGTVVEATKRLKELGARSVVAACVHAVMADFAAVKLFNAGVNEIVATDTIEKIYSEISVAGILAKSIR